MSAASSTTSKAVTRDDADRGRVAHRNARRESDNTERPWHDRSFGEDAVTRRTRAAARHDHGDAVGVPRRLCTQRPRYRAIGCDRAQRVVAVDGIDAGVREFDQHLVVRRCWQLYLLDGEWLAMLDESSRARLHPHSPSPRSS